MVNKILVMASLALLAGRTPGPRFEVNEFWATTTPAVKPGTSFAWDPECIERGMGIDLADPDIDEWVRDRIEEKLVELGYPRHTGRGLPGMIISTHFVAQTKQVGFSRDQADVGAIVIEVYEPERGTLVWRGWAAAPIDYSMPPARRQERMHTAISRTLERFGSRATVE